MSLEFHSPALEGPKGCIHQKEGCLFQSLKSSGAELPPCQAAAAGAVLVSMVLASAAGELVEGQVQPEPSCTVSGIHGSAGLEEPDPPGVWRRRDAVAPVSGQQAHRARKAMAVCAGGAQTRSPPDRGQRPPLLGSFCSLQAWRCQVSEFSSKARNPGFDLKSDC